MEAINSETYEIVFLDLGLPLVDGLDVLRTFAQAAAYQ